MLGATAGEVVGQLAKCRYVCEELGFDACVDYRLHANAFARIALYGMIAGDNFWDFSRAATSASSS